MQKKRMHSVGFEPTRTNTLDLKTNPLDQLGQLCFTNIYNVISLNIFMC